MPFVLKKSGTITVVHNRRVDSKVQQDVLWRFRSPHELASTLEEGWTPWAETMQWRHSDIEWAWEALRDRLRAELATWLLAPSGAVVRRENRAQSLSEDLLEALSDLSPVQDRELVETVKLHLEKLTARINALNRTRSPYRPQEISMRAKDAVDPDEIFDAGMEYWWAGDRVSAARYFRKVIKLDALHGEAHNHLGIYVQDRRIKEAEKHFNLAIEGAARHIISDAGQVSWGHLENRAYLRPLHNLGLLHMRQQRFEEAIEIFERLLFLNPNDNQGVRWLVGEAYHRAGYLDQAITCYERALEEPGVCFGLVLALFERGKTRRLGLAVLRAIATNRYIVPMLLGEPWKEVGGYFGSNMAEPDWASDYVEKTADLWRKAPGSAQFLRQWWHAEPLRAWLAALDQIAVDLKSEREIEKRRGLIDRRAALVAKPSLLTLAQQVDPSSVSAPRMRRPYVASPDQVRITRDGESAYVEYAEENVGGVNLAFGPGLETMTDEEVLARHNEILDMREDFAADYEHVAVEVPWGSKQIKYESRFGWTMRGHVLRCAVDYDPDEEHVAFRVDDQVLSLAEFGKMLSTFEGWALRIIAVPEHELCDEPVIEVREPED